MDFKKYVIKALKEANYRITEPRKKVLEVLLKSKKPLNPYKIAEKMGKSEADISTIYRILEVYENLGIVHQIRSQGYTTCQGFECAENTHCHHQFVCKNCKSVSEVHLEDKDFLESLKSKLKGFKLLDHYFEFSGLCKTCNH